MLGTSIGVQAVPASHYIHINGMRLHYLEWGHPNNPPVFLLHSTEDNAHSWDLVGPALSSDYHVIALDSRGVGESQRQADVRYPQEDYMRDLELFFEAQAWHSDVIFVGQAWGGRYAHIFAARHPELLRALVLVDTAPEMGFEGIMEVLNYLQQLMRVDSYETFVAKMHAHNPRRPIEQIRAMLWHDVEQLADGAWTWKRDYRPIFPYKAQALDANDYLWETLRAVRCPTLIVRGEHSTLVHAEIAQRMLEAVPDARLVTIEKAAHLVVGDNPRAFEKALRAFLAELP